MYWYVRIFIFELYVMYIVSSDNDECSMGTDLCQQNCNNTLGSYECSCNSGYYERGFQCKGNNSGQDKTKKHLLILCARY